MKKSKKTLSGNFEFSKEFLSQFLDNFYCTIVIKNSKNDKTSILASQCNLGAYNLRIVTTSDLCVICKSGECRKGWMSSVRFIKVFVSNCLQMFLRMKHYPRKQKSLINYWFIKLFVFINLVG